MGQNAVRLSVAIFGLLHGANPSPIWTVAAVNSMCSRKHILGSIVCSSIIDGAHLVYSIEVVLHISLSHCLFHYHTVYSIDSNLPQLRRIHYIDHASLYFLGRKKRRPSRNSAWSFRHSTRKTRAPENRLTWGRRIPHTFATSSEKDHPNIICIRGVCANTRICAGRKVCDTCIISWWWHRGAATTNGIVRCICVGDVDRYDRTRNQGLSLYWT